MSERTILPLAALIRDDDIQPRAALDPGTIADYAALYADDQELPPLVVFQDGRDFWLADGFHRVEAVLQAFPMGMDTELPVELHQGTRRDAMLYAAGCN